MRAHYLQHVPFEGLGSIESWLNEAGCRISSTRLYETEALPGSSEFDALIVMGGPMSVNDEIHEWLSAEKRFIREAIDANKRILGICLGAQLIACSLGARVGPNEYKEIGWYPVSGVSPPGDPVFQFPAELEVFHWHGETFELPAGAARLAESPGCRNQGFQVGRNLIGFQFHLETTPGSAAEIVSNCSDELVPAPYVQDAGAILSVSSGRYAAINAVMGDVLAYLFG
jgi:GMP synthase-like glutamine amidotransferase